MKCVLAFSSASPCVPVCVHVRNAYNADKQIAANFAHSRWDGSDNVHITALRRVPLICPQQCVGGRKYARVVVEGGCPNIGRTAVGGCGAVCRALSDSAVGCSQLRRVRGCGLSVGVLCAVPQVHVLLLCSGAVLSCASRSPAL